MNLSRYTHTYWQQGRQFQSCPSREKNGSGDMTYTPSLFKLLEFFIVNSHTLQGTNIPPKNGILKMIFLVPRWDMYPFLEGTSWMLFFRISWDGKTIRISRCAAPLCGYQKESILPIWLDDWKYIICPTPGHKENHCQRAYTVGDMLVATQEGMYYMIYIYMLIYRWYTYIFA